MAIFIILLGGCKPSKSVVPGAPAQVKARVLKEDMHTAENSYSSLLLSGNASYEKEGQSQNFKLEVRILHDSLIWVDIADPILGIKVARAILYHDSVAFVNRMQKEYFTGKVADLQKRLNLDFGFNEIQAIMSGNLVFNPDKEFELYYRPGFYLLSDFTPEQEARDTNIREKYFGKERFRQIFVDPHFFKPVEQIQNEPAMGKNYTITQHDFAAREGLLMPSELIIDYTMEEKAKLTFEIRRIRKDEPQLNYPFNIPSDYAEMR